MDEVRLKMISEMKAVAKSCRDQNMPEETTRVQLFFSLPHLDLMIKYLEDKRDN